MPVCSPTFKKMYSFQVLFFFWKCFNPPVLTSAADSSPVWGTVQFTNGSCRRDPALLEFPMDPRCTNTSVRSQSAVWSVVQYCPVAVFLNYDPEPFSVTRLCVHLCERCETRVLSFLYSEPIVITLILSRRRRGEGRGSRNVKRAGENC